MLDINYIRDNLEKVKTALAKKHSKFDLDQLVKLDQERKKILQKVESLRSKRHQAAQKKDIEGGRKIKLELEKIEKLLDQSTKKLNDQLQTIHNIPHSSVPSFREGSKVVKTWGKIPKFDFKPKDHLELGEALDLIDVKRAAKVSGSRFGYFKNEAVILQFALIRWALDELSKNGFTPIIPPVLVKEKAMFGTGFFPAEENEYYKTALDDLFLVGTSEVPIASYHMDEILEQKLLPLKYAAYSSCFRRESGSYGQDVKGVLRVHQFDKIEMFKFCHPENSWQEFEELRKLAEGFLEKLGIPYQTINMSGGDIGAPNAKKYDTEGWFPSQNKYRELQSCSHDTDFQARRLNIRLKDKNGQAELVHTMNSTAIAMGRTIICLMENYQQKDGSIKIPEILQKHTGFKEIK
jgi:seryl-tRNA synthetase